MRTLGLPHTLQATHDLRRALAAIVRRRFGKDARLVSPGPWPHPYRSTAQLEVWGIAGAPEGEVVIKRPSQRNVRPPFVRQPVLRRCPAIRA